jgi:hypothetical protein
MKLDDMLHAHATESAGDVSVMLHHASDCHSDLQLLADNTRRPSSLHFALAQLASIGRQTEIAIQNHGATHAPETR